MIEQMKGWLRKEENKSLYWIAAYRIWAWWMVMHLSVRLFARFCNDLQKGKIRTASKIVKEAVHAEMKSDSTSCSERKFWQALQPIYDHPTSIVEYAPAQENTMI